MRVYYQVLFLSDIQGASGKHLHTRYLELKAPEERWPRINVPRERPSLRDIKLWRVVLRQLVPPVGVADKLGPLGLESPKI